MLKIALAGNPNSGKTTMFNALTGQNERVGNWTGVTVDKAQHSVKKLYSGDEKIIAVDLPGAYSMSPFTSEESITRDYIKTECPDVIINIVDATNLSRSLFFTTQLLELGIPMVIALNKADINKKNQTTIDEKALEEALGCPVVGTVSTSSKGLSELLKKAKEQVGKTIIAPYHAENLDTSDKKAVLDEDKKRFAFVDGIVLQVETKKFSANKKNIHDKIDAILTNKWLSIPIFAVVMFLVFQISQAWLGAFIADWLTELIGEFKAIVTEWLIGINPLLQAFILEGIIEGVSAVVSFLPLVMVMYFLIALLEDCGYMARVSVVLDPIFKKVGLSGRSVIPFVIGTGCAVPGVMACRTIKNEKERKASALLAPFMPCGAKLPVISLFVGVFFPKNPWIGTAMYFLGIFVILICALIINAITGLRNKKSYFIIELPLYKFPSLPRALNSMLDRGKAYVIKAGTIILLCNFAVYLMQNFTWSFAMTENPNESILASIASPVSFVIAPIIGVVAWKFAASAVTGFIAKECVVGTLATCFAFGSLLNEEGLALVGNGTIAAEKMGITPAAALGFLMFNLFSPPCFAAIGAMNAELKSKKWLFGGIALQLLIGYSLGFLAFFFGSVFLGEPLGEAWMPILGWAIVLLFVLTLSFIIIRNQRRFKSENRSKNTSGANAYER